MVNQKLQTEYYALLKEFKEGHTRMTCIKQRMAQIRKIIKINPQIVDERPDENLLKEK